MTGAVAGSERRGRRDAMRGLSEHGHRADRADRGAGAGAVAGAARTPGREARLGTIGDDLFGTRCLLTSGPHTDGMISHKSLRRYRAMTNSAFRIGIRSTV